MSHGTLTENFYEMKADDVSVWTGYVYPTQRDIDRAATRATARGWNGTTIDLFQNDHWIATVYPSPDALC